MRYFALLLLVVTPTVFSLPFAETLPYALGSSTAPLLLAGLVSVALIRRRQK